MTRGTWMPVSSTGMTQGRLGLSQAETPVLMNLANITRLSRVGKNCRPWISADPRPYA
jgi:hypothetical protein